MGPLPSSIGWGLGYFNIVVSRFGCARVRLNRMPASGHVGISCIRRLALFGISFLPPFNPLIDLAPAELTRLN
jgi:hypothetical protein